MPPAGIVQKPNLNPGFILWELKSPVIQGGFCRVRSRRTTTSSTRGEDSVPSPVVLSSSSLRVRSSSSLAQPYLRYAVLGAGFAGLSVAYHLLQHSPRGLRLCIDIYDEVGIGGGASGVSGGLLHPYSPKAKLLWRGAECWKECLNLLSIAEAVVASRDSTLETKEFDRKFDRFIVRRRGILRPAMNMKNFSVLNDVISSNLPSETRIAELLINDFVVIFLFLALCGQNAQNCLSSCRIESIDKNAAQNLVPNLSIPFNSAFFMPEAVNVHPQCYLQALFLACENQVKKMSTLGFGEKELYLHKKSVNKLFDLAGEYDAVIICLGAKADMLPELSGRLPLRTCRGVIAHLQLPDDRGEEYPDHSPSILSDAWLAVQGPRNLYMGATWEWKSRNYSPEVSAEEASKAFHELLPKVSTVYPCIKDWAFSGAKAGLRAMPPLTPNGSLPLLGCVDDFVGGNHTCKYWLFGGLGSRGLLYHGLLGKLMAQAVLSCDEKLIPSELISWKKIKK